MSTCDTLKGACADRFHRDKYLTLTAVRKERQGCPSPVPEKCVLDVLTGRGQDHQVAEHDHHAHRHAHDVPTGTNGAPDRKHKCKQKARRHQKRLFVVCMRSPEYSGGDIEHDILAHRLLAPADHFARLVPTQIVIHKICYYNSKERDNARIMVITWSVAH